MKKGPTRVDHTTASASLAKELYEEAKKRGIGFIDAPVSGGQAGAVNGQLGIMCGGESAVFEKTKPVIDVYAKLAALIGGASAGQLTQIGDPSLDVPPRPAPGHAPALRQKKQTARPYVHV